MSSKNFDNEEYMKVHNSIQERLELELKLTSRLIEILEIQKENVEHLLRFEHYTEDPMFWVIDGRKVIDRQLQRYDVASAVFVRDKDVHKLDKFDK